MVRVLFVFFGLLTGTVQGLLAHDDHWRRYFVDFNTNEILAITTNFNLGEMNTKPTVYYSTNNGKYIQMTVVSATKVEGDDGVTPQLIAYFPAKPNERYTLTLNNPMSCGTYLTCKNPDGSEQMFCPSNYDSVEVPTAQYGTLLLPFNKPEQYFAYLFTDFRTKESLALIKQQTAWHLLYRSSKSKKFIEMQVIGIDKTIASFKAVFPNDKSKKYTLRYFCCSSAMSIHLNITNPDGSKQEFYLDMEEMGNSTVFDGVKPPAQIMEELLAK